MCPPPLLLRNIEDLLHERGIEVSPETERAWWVFFGPTFAAEIWHRRVSGLRASRWRWHLDEVLVRINGEPHELWRAVDREGEGLEVYVSQPCDEPCDEAAALGLRRQPMRRHGRAEELVMDKELAAGELRLLRGGSRRGRGSASGR